MNDVFSVRALQGDIHFPDEGTRSDSLLLLQNGLFYHSETPLHMAICVPCFTWAIYAIFFV